MFDDNAYLAVGAAPDTIREGVPFWLFWLLLCVILLLLFFIFLRDKDLRRRLSAFLSGARRRVIRMRLAARIRREKEKKVRVWRELGQKAWSENVRVAGTEETFRSLSAVEEEMNRRQAEWRETYERIEGLEAAREKARASRKTAREAEEAALRPLEEKLHGLQAKEKEAAKLRSGSGTGPAPGEASGLADEIAAAKADVGRARAKVRDLRRAHDEADRAEEREIREWNKRKEEIQDRITAAKKAAEPFTESLGRAVDEARLEHKDLAPFYVQLDAADRAIKDLQARIEKLS